MTLQPVIDDFEQLTGTITTFLGFRPSASDLETFPYTIYKFLIKRIRFLDEVLGTKLVQRFLDGPQEVWATMENRGLDLLNLFDPTEIEARFLPSLRKLVAFNDDLLDLVNAASEDELRVIIEGAIEFWQKRATREAGYKTAVNLVTGNRFKLRGYHDFKFILDETIIMEELENLDPFMIDVQTVNRFRQGNDGVTRASGNVRRFSSASGAFEDPEDVGAFIVIQDNDTPDSNGFYEIVTVLSSTDVIVDSDFPTAETGLTWFVAFHYDEYLTEIRVVDDLTGDGALNRSLLTKLLEETRPNSERVNVVYVSFMDLFTTANDLGQWQFTIADQYQPVVANGFLSLANQASLSPGFMVTDYFDDDTWKNYTLKSKIAQKEPIGIAASFSIVFLRTDDLNYYTFDVIPSTPTDATVELWRVVGGAFTQLGSTIDFPDLSPDIFFTYTIDVFRDEATGLTRIDVKIDGDTFFSETDSNFDTGNFGYRVARFGAIEVTEVELWQYPLTIDRVGPNP
jgi:hypothetical protein